MTDSAEDQIEQLGRSDRTEMDLLTKALARSLLDQEITAQQAEIDRLARGEVGADMILSLEVLRSDVCAT